MSPSAESRMAPQGREICGLIFDSVGLPLLGQIDLLCLMGVTVIRWMDLFISPR